jgi:hypothetical protein
MSLHRLTAKPELLSWLRRRVPWALGAILLVCGISGTAYAFWQSTDSSNFAAASADSLPQGPTPTATATDATTVGVSWATTTTTGGRALTGYTVARYNAATGGTKTPATGGCAGTITSTSCTEQSVPGGTWYYTVTPTLSLWTGVESPRSAGVSTDSTPPTVIVSSISPAPNVNGYNNSSPVTVNLSATDNTGGSGVASITYWVDSGTHTTVNATTAAVSVTGDGTHTLSYLATDNASNASTTQTQTVKIDTVAPGAPTVSVPSYVNSANGTNVPVSGTAEANATVALTVTDAGAAHTVTQTVTANGSGAWSTSSLNLSTLNQGTITYSATATDAADNAGAAGTATGTKDTAVETATITAPTYINSATKSSVAISGTADANASISVAISDVGNVHTTTVTTTTADGTGAWSKTAINLSSFNDGTITFALTETDAAGNQGTASTTSSKDTAVETATITAPTYINSSTKSSVAISGTADANASISVAISDVGSVHTTTVTTTADGIGAWSKTAINLSSFNDGTITFALTETDAAGNQGTASTTSTKDTVAPAAPSSVSLSNGGGQSNAYINSSNTTSVNYNVVEPASANDSTTDTVRVTLTSSGGGSAVTGSAAGSGSAGGTVAVTGMNASGLGDGTVTASVTVTDLAGNVSSPTTATSTKDTVAPSSSNLNSNSSKYIYHDNISPSTDTISSGPGSIILQSGETAVAVVAIEQSGGPHPGNRYVSAYTSASTFSTFNVDNAISNLTYQFFAMDVAGNVASTSSASVTGTDTH